MVDKELQEARLSDYAWGVFREAFRDGEFVVIEDDDGRFWYGKLTAYQQGIRLERHLLPTKNFDWKQVVFIAHDGFPVQPIEKMAHEECEELCNRTPTDVLRDSIQRCVEVGEKLRQPRRVSKPKSKPEEPVPRPTPTPRRGRPNMSSAHMHIGGGCPFQFGPCEVEALYFPGRNGPDYWGVRDDEETLVLRGGDGAVMHSFDLDHLFLFDGLDLPHRQATA